MAKYGQLLTKRNQERNCLEQVEDDWQIVNSHNRDVMIDKARTGRRLLIICALFMYSTGVSFRTIIPLSAGKIITEQNFTVRHLPCPTYFVLFDVQLSPAYEIVFLMQFFSEFVKCTVTTAICGLAGLFVMHTCAQLDILMILMNNLEWEDNNAVALCSYLVGLTSISFNIFIFCFIGEQLSTKGEKVALTACTLEWYRLPDAKARSLILIMLMSNPPTKVRGGKYFDLSFRTFGN
ncbi:uncharacterized protein, partial [Mycetomoellerius zeteki]|uniref:uncharacterized protein n=1 Tax=Mycetomoellerius zeteki TaxID=64791 RepID=UPI00084E82EE